MPELPEVETIKRQLKQAILYSTVTGVIFGPQAKLRYPFNFSEADLFQKQCTHIERHGKNLLLSFEDTHLRINLGLTGNLQLRHDTSYHKHDHLTFMFNDGLKLVFHDPRRFGYCLAYDQELSPLAIIGMDALDKAFDSAYLLQRCSSSTVTIKQILMNNKIVMGIGNIYASEILFAAQVSPLRRGKSIQAVDSVALIDATQRILLKSISMGGTTFRDYRHLDGMKGTFLTELRVYQQKHCRTCSQNITRIVIGQRSTYFCAHCQH